LRQNSLNVVVDVVLVSSRVVPLKGTSNGITNSGQDLCGVPTESLRSVSASIQGHNWSLEEVC
jgi:hypothetical protein